MALALMRPNERKEPDVTWSGVQRRTSLLACALALVSLLQGGLAWAQAPSAPPPPRVEKPSPSPGPNWVWIAGYWAWQGGQWTWVGGRWEEAQGRSWIPGRYRKTDQGWLYEPGRWTKP
jgi:hypothetical protein